jgi:hypothetical protein
MKMGCPGHRSAVAHHGDGALAGLDVERGGAGRAEAVAHGGGADVERRKDREQVAASVAAASSIIRCSRAMRSGYRSKCRLTTPPDRSRHIARRREAPLSWLRSSRSGRHRLNSSGRPGCSRASHARRSRNSGIVESGYCAADRFFRSFAKVPWRMTKEAPELQPVVFVIGDV